MVMMINASAVQFKRLIIVVAGFILWPRYGTFTEATPPDGYSFADGMVCPSNASHVLCQTSDDFGDYYYNAFLLPTGIKTVIGSHELNNDDSDCFKFASVNGTTMIVDFAPTNPPTYGTFKITIKSVLDLGSSVDYFFDMSRPPGSINIARGANIVCLRSRVYYVNGGGLTVYRMSLSEPTYQGLYFESTKGETLGSASDMAASKNISKDYPNSVIPPNTTTIVGSVLGGDTSSDCFQYNVAKAGNVTIVYRTTPKNATNVLFWGFPGGNYSEPLARQYGACPKGAVYPTPRIPLMPTDDCRVYTFSKGANYVCAVVRLWGGPAVDYQFDFSVAST